MDWGSLAGLVLALAAIAGGQWVEGGRLGALMQPAALVIVVGGTLGAVLLQNGMGTLWRGLRLAGKAFSPQPPFYEALIASIQGWSKTARADGFLQLERYLTDQRDPFIAKGIRMLVDNVDAETLRSILETDIDSYERWERQSIRVWEAAGGYAPTIGILGAVLGLMRVMDNLGEPALLGSGIAVAFVATVYGVGTGQPGLPADRQQAQEAAGARAAQAHHAGRCPGQHRARRELGRDPGTHEQPLAARRLR